MRKRAAATSRLVRPSATSAAIRRSASVSSPREGAAPADARQLGARLLGPERRAEPLEARERVLERRARGAALLRAPLRSAEREQRARVVERIGAPGMLGERVLEAREGTLEIAPRREQQPSTPCEDRERPGPVERLGAPLPRREDLVGLVELADRDQRLEQVAELEAQCRLEHEAVAKLVRAPQVRQRRVRRLRARARRSRAPSRGPTARCRCPSASARAICALRPGARVVDPSAVRGNHGSGQLVRSAITRPSCVASSIESFAYWSASSQFPARHSRKLRNQRRLCLSRSAIARSCAQELLEEVARAVDVRRPAELVAVDDTSDRPRAATPPAIARARAPPASPRLGMPRPALKCMRP